MVESSNFSDSQHCLTTVQLDKTGRSERSSGAAVRIGRASVHLAEGDAGETAARAQAEALHSIARRLGLLDEKGVSDVGSVCLVRTGVD